MNYGNNCARKHRFETKDAAVRSAIRLHKQSRKYAGLRAYPCKIGGEEHWHVGRVKNSRPK